MDQGTDRITQDIKDIAQTRAGIADKLGLIERRLTSSVEEAKAMAEDMITRTQTKVEEAVDSVKAATDPRRLANDHPWLLLSGAVAVGFTLRLAIASCQRPKGVTPYYPPGAHPAEVMPPPGQRTDRREGVFPFYPNQPGRTKTVPHRKGSSLLDELGGTIAQEFGHVKGELIAMAGGMLRAWLRELLHKSSAPSNRAGGVSSKVSEASQRM